MYPVTQDFIDKMRADKRQVDVRVTIDYTNWEIDQSIDVSAPDQANVSYPSQTADGVAQATHKWASLDGSWVLDGSYHLAPEPQDLTRYQFGWWSAQLSGPDGAFSEPFPTLVVTHIPRPVHSLRVVGDTAREEWPVDFRVDLYAEDGTLLRSEAVTGNTAIEWSKNLSTPVLDVARQELVITRWSHPGRQAKIVEFFTSIQETYYRGDVVEVRLLEEREASQGSLPVGNVSANEITLRLANEGGKFDVTNRNSPLAGLLKPNRRIRAWLGTDGRGNLARPPLDIDWWNAAPKSGIVWGNANTYDYTEGALKITSYSSAHNGHSFYLPIELDIEFTIRALIKNVKNALHAVFYIALYNASGVCIKTNYAPQIVAQFGWIKHYSPDYTEGWLTYKIRSSDILANYPTAAYYTIQLIGGGSTASEIYMKQISLKRGTDRSFDGYDEWVPLGTFWSLDWDSPDDTLEASVTARDRLELLRKSTYTPGQVQQNISLYTLAEQVLVDAGLQPGKYWIDPALQQTVIPWAWLSPTSHREALRIIAEAGLAVVYADRDGVIRVESMSSVPAASDVEITADDYFPPLSAPSRQDQVANEVVVTTQPLRPADAPQEVYRSMTPINVPAGQTVVVTVQYTQTPVIEATASLISPPTGVSIVGATYYAWGAEVSIKNISGSQASVTLVVTGKPLSVQGGEQVITRDQTSIIENGVLRYEYPANPLVQTLAQAQAIANALLASAKDPRRDIEVEWRGNPAVELGDKVKVVGQDVHVIRQEITWAGAMTARLTGRRVT